MTYDCPDFCPSYFAWFVWDARSAQKRIVDWFDWKQFPVKPRRPDVERQAGSFFQAAA
jgi:hypothetical protein